MARLEMTPCLGAPCSSESVFVVALPTMAIRYRIRNDGVGEYLADHVDRLGHRRARRFESREAAEAFLKKVQKADFSRNAATPSVEPELVEDAA